MHYYSSCNAEKMIPQMVLLSLFYHLFSCKDLFKPKIKKNSVGFTKVSEIQIVFRMLMNARSALPGQNMLPLGFN